MRERRVLISATGPHGSVLKIRPPLPFGPEHADQFLAVLSDVLSSTGPVAGGPGAGGTVAGGTVAGAPVAGGPGADLSGPGLPGTGLPGTGLPGVGGPDGGDHRP
jgi:hypothetical protein